MNEAFVAEGFLEQGLLEEGIRGCTDYGGKSRHDFVDRIGKSSLRVDGASVTSPACGEDQYPFKQPNSSALGI
jgi:hypothetical protein